MSQIFPYRPVRNFYVVQHTVNKVYHATEHEVSMHFQAELKVKLHFRVKCDNIYEYILQQEQFL